MKNNILKKSLSVFISGALLLSLSACNNKQNEANKGEDGELAITIPSYYSGENVGAVFFEPHIERFNEKYKGKYKINIEEITQDNYGEKIKQLAQQNKLPVLVQSGFDEQWFQDVAVANDMVYDLSEWAENTEVKDNWIPNSIEKCTIDGKLLVQPSTTIRPIGLFYNSAIYDPGKPVQDMTFDEFFESLGDNKLAFQTAENAWTTALLLSTLIASKDGGVELLNSHTVDKLYDYTDPIIVESFKEIKEIFDKYGADTSIGAAYADAANTFMSGNAAVIFNGSWMVDDFSEDASDNWSNGFNGEDVRYETFPENIVIGNDKMYGRWWVSNQATDEEKELAKAYLEFCDSQEETEAYILAEGGVAPELDYSDDFVEKQKQNPITYNFINQINEDTVYTENLLDVIPTSIAESELNKLLPKLLDGSFTAEEFCQELTNKAQAIKN